MKKENYWFIIILALIAAYILGHWNAQKGLRQDMEAYSGACHMEGGEMGTLNSFPVCFAKSQVSQKDIDAYFVGKKHDAYKICSNHKGKWVETPVGSWCTLNGKIYDYKDFGLVTNYTEELN